ncbi:MAG: hypothetical protein IPG53_00770 [Ignavibacteriales bacterium]|nr:hypothetical protein [Ignavibacteriales bacterium]
MKTLIKSTWLIVSLLMSFNSPELNGQTVNFPFMRFSGIDRWEGLTSSTGNGGAVTYSYSSWKTNDSVMFDSIMFYMRGSSLHGFDADSNKYYYLVNGVKNYILILVFLWFNFLRVTLVVMPGQCQWRRYHEEVHNSLRKLAFL